VPFLALSRESLAATFRVYAKLLGNAFMFYCSGPHLFKPQRLILPGVLCLNCLLQLSNLRTLNYVLRLQSRSPPPYQRTFRHPPPLKVAVPPILDCCMLKIREMFLEYPSSRTTLEDSGGINGRGRK
jgi:hypothetical protein